MRLPVNNAVITSSYGMRQLNGKPQFHDGIDFISRANNMVFSISNGTVIYDKDNYRESFRFSDPKESGGNCVIVQFKNNSLTYYVRYWHLIENNVKKDQVISENYFIGRYGDVGLSYGAHLHIDLYIQGNTGWIKSNIEDFFRNNKVL